MFNCTSEIHSHLYGLLALWNYYYTDKLAIIVHWFQWFLCATLAVTWKYAWDWISRDMWTKRQNYDFNHASRLGGFQWRIVQAFCNSHSHSLSFISNWWLLYPTVEKLQFMIVTNGLPATPCGKFVGANSSKTKNCLWNSQLILTS